MGKHIKSFTWILLITIGCKIFGFIRELVMAYCYGTSDVVDAFLMAESLPSVFFGWTTAFATAFVPVYQTLRSNSEEKQKQDEYVNSMMMVITLFSFFFVCVGILFANKIIQFGAAGFSVEQKQRTYSMYLICTVSYLYYSQIQMVTNYLNCHEKFIKATLPTLLISPIQTLFVYLAYKIDKPIFMAIGVAIATLLQIILALYFAYNEGYRFKIKLRITEEVKNTVKLACPLFLSAIVTRVNVMIDKMFASNLSTGSISALGYGETLRTIFYSLISIIITSMFFPMVSKAVAEKNYSRVTDGVHEIIKIITIVATPLTILSLAFSEWGTSIVYMRGSFDYSSMIMTSTAFSMYMIGIIAMLFRDICNNFFQAYKNATIPLVVCVLIVLLNISLNFVLVRMLGYIGIALATSLANMLVIPIEITLMKRKVSDISLKRILNEFMKILVASLITGVISYVCVNKFDNIFFQYSLFVKIGLLLGIFVLAISVYLILLVTFKIVSLNEMKGILERVIKRRKKE